MRKQQNASDFQLRAATIFAYICAKVVKKQKLFLYFIFTYEQNTTIFLKKCYSSQKNHLQICTVYALYLVRYECTFEVIKCVRRASTNSCQHFIRKRTFLSDSRNHPGQSVAQHTAQSTALLSTGAEHIPCIIDNAA